MINPAITNSATPLKEPLIFQNDNNRTFLADASRLANHMATRLRASELVSDSMCPLSDNSAKLFVKALQQTQEP